GYLIRFESDSESLLEFVSVTREAPLSYKIEKVAVLGAGTMGAQIAAHLANAGIDVLLLDIAPKELTKEETAKGLSLDSKQVKNRIAYNGLEMAKKIKPAAFFSLSLTSLVSIGNFDGDLQKISGCDWVIEAVIENLEIKRALYEKVDYYRKRGSIISSNTSGI